jgi:thymidylate kinase
VREQSALGRGFHEAAESVFLAEFFRALDAELVHYVVLRNYAHLPHSAGGSDLDILIPPYEEGKFRGILFRSVEHAGGVVIGCSETFGFIKAFAFGFVDSSDNGWWGLCIDVNVGYTYKGARILFPHYLIENQAKHREIKVMESGLAAVLGVLKEVLNNNHVPTRYQSDAGAAVQHDWPTLCNVLRPIGDRGITILRELILSVPDPAQVVSRARALRRTLFWQALINSPRAFLRGRVLSEWSKVRRYLRPSGVVIAVLGVDGVGKSTVINTIAPVLKEAAHGAFSVQHLRPGLLPPLADLKGKRTGQVGPVLAPHGSTPSGPMGSIIRLFYLALDYVLGYWFLLRPKLAKSPAVLLFDRYFYDIMLDPRRFRIGFAGRKLAWFLRLLPKPDIVLCLHASPEVIAFRKQELPLDEISRQVEALRELAHIEPRAILVSTEGRVEEVRDRVLKALCEFFVRGKCNGC